MTAFRWGVAFLLLAGMTLAVNAAEDPKPVVAKTVVLALSADNPDIQKLIDQQQKEQKEAIEKVSRTGTHRILAEVVVKSKDGMMQMQTLTSDAVGTIYALVAQPRGFNAPTAKAVSEIHVLDRDGKPLGLIAVGFHAHSVAVGPDGVLYVAGDGKVARYGKDRKQIGTTVELPHIADLLKDTDGLKVKAETQVKLQKESFANMIKQYKDRVAKLEEVKEADRSKTQIAQLKSLKQNLESFAETEKYYDTITVDSVLKGLTDRLRVINGIAASEKDVFIVCGETEGYGFAIWRLEPDLKNAKKVMTGVSGCCGQMDIQCCESDLLVAENTRHRFAKYTRDGKEMFAGGKRGKETEPGCFGGCCNPMNVRAVGGDVFTAESEGIVKKFTSTGEFVQIVGAVKISGGCKNVAIGATSDGSRVFFCDQPESKIHILALKDEKKDEKK